MSDKIDRAAIILTNRSETWVQRRDAASLLGSSARRALEPLKACENDKDVDVQRTVKQALEDASRGLTPPPSGSDRTYTLEELARACEKRNERVVRPEADGFVIDVKLPKRRKQKVYLRNTTRRDGVKLLQVFTYCGNQREDALAWALRANMKIPHGALALEKDGNEERFVLTRSVVADEATPLEVKRLVKGIAFYGDRVEERFTGQDEL